MPTIQRPVRISRGFVAAWAVAAAPLLVILSCRPHSAARNISRSHTAARFDTSLPLQVLSARRDPEGSATCRPSEQDCGTSAGDPEEPEEALEPNASHSGAPTPGAAIEQTRQGPRPPAALIDSFDGLGFGFSGPRGTTKGRSPSDNSLAIGPNHIVQIVNSRLAVYTKKGAQFDITGKVLYGPVVTNTIFSGFGGQCEHRVSGDAVVRYDQLAGRWLYVLPIFHRPPDDPKGPYSMCYAVTAGPDPLGPYHRYEFKRDLFPDYPRPAIWPDGYYVPTSTGDTVIQKHACVADRNRMLAGLSATEQCVIIDGVNFLNNADLDGNTLPPPGAPNIILAAGGTQLRKRFEDDGIYAYKFHVDWETPANTKVSEAQKITVAPYHYLCDGQLTNCVPQPGTDRRLDAQGDKIMQRLVYRNAAGHESIVALHSVNTQANGGGIRWYEFRLDANRDPYLFQQGTYAPDGFYRWMGSMATDRLGDIGIGYSFGGTPNFAGQRFAARLANDALGQLTFHETLLAEGAAAQTDTMRWEDYATTAMDPSDDCTFWYVGDYFKAGAKNYSTRIGSFRLPGCLVANITGTVFFDRNHNGHRDVDEPGLSGRNITYTGSESGSWTTGRNGNFSASLPADPAYRNTIYTISFAGKANSVDLSDRNNPPNIDLAEVCTVRGASAAELGFWSHDKGRALLAAHEGEWHDVINSKSYLVNADGSRFTGPDAGSMTDQQFQKWLRGKRSQNPSHDLSQQLAVALLNVAVAREDPKATIHDPVKNDWPSIAVLLNRVSMFLSINRDTSARNPAKATALAYYNVLASLNQNRVNITPEDPAACRLRP